MQSVIASEAGIKLHTEDDVLDLIGSGLPACILSVEDLHPQFFDLRNGHCRVHISEAGELPLQSRNHPPRGSRVRSARYGVGERTSSSSGDSILCDVG